MVSEQFIPSLETRPFGTPLRRFRGVLDNYATEKRIDQGSNREYMTIVFSFLEVVVIESVEPYPFPIATISIGYSTTTDTRWDVLASSIKKLFGTTPTLDELVKKQQEWAYLPCKLTTRLESGDWAKVDQEAWQVVGLEGLNAGSPTQAAQDITEHILGLLEGKTEQEFYQVFYQDPQVKGHPDLITAATERRLLSSMEDAGRIHRDTQGVWYRGAQPEA